MIARLRLLRGALALGIVLLWLGLVGIPSLVLLGAAVRRRGTPARIAWVSRWARVHCRIVLAMLRAGGARFSRRGTVPTDQPGIVVMNHQSVVDVPTVVLMCRPVVPVFLARERYARAPLIGRAMALADCVVVDPQDREVTLAALAGAVRHDRPVMLFPEGHRSLDGGVQPFRSSGMVAMLAARRVPVWLIATDGFCSGRRMADLFRLHDMRGRTEVIGRFEPPPDPADLPAFVARLEGEVRTAVEGMRTVRDG